MASMSGAGARTRSLATPFGITALFVLLTALMTWPQVLVLKTHAIDHLDVFFNVWRLRWIAHALSTSPADLFNANTFHPDRGVLAYSDAMLVEGFLAAPLLWAGLPPLLVHNLLLLGAIVASGVGIFGLARHITGSTAAALVAGVIFAFAPYRFDHYMHMELQWIVWSPWAFWALQRTIESGSIRYGILTGVFVALQMASSVYYGVFLSILMAPVALLQLMTLRGQQLASVMRAVLLAGALGASLSWGYSLPYAAASARVGIRSIDEARIFSARPDDYLVATPNNVLYGSHDAGIPERRLLPGLLPPLLALAGLLLVPPTTVAIAYLVGLIVAFELSLGVNGYLYPLLYEHVGVIRGLRVPARAAAFCLLFLGVLAAHGAAVLGRTVRRRFELPVAALACVAVLFEFRVAPLPLVPYPNEPPPLYRLLAQLPPGVVIEFPVPRANSLPYHEPRYAFMSTFHWMPLLNGYSGFYPPSYLRRLARLATFPDEESVASLRREKVKYLVVHDEGYGDWDRVRVVERLVGLGASPIADLKDGWGVATLMELK